MLLEEFVAQPVFESLGLAALESGAGNKRSFVEGAERGGEELAQAGSGGLFAVDRREANDAVLIGELLQSIGPKRWTIGEAAAGLARPAVAEQAGDGDVERLVGTLWMAVEEPLGRITAVRLG